MMRDTKSLKRALNNAGEKERKAAKPVQFVLKVLMMLHRDPVDCQIGQVNERRAEATSREE